MVEASLRILSLGAGVQSTTLFLLAAEGRLGHLDAAIFSDTGWEPKAVYRHLNRLEREVAGPAGIPIYRVTKGNIRNDALDPEHRFASMPLFVLGPPREVREPIKTEVCGCGWDGTVDPDVTDLAGCPKCKNTGIVVTEWSKPRIERSPGMTRRQCSNEYKVVPIKRKVRELLGYVHPTPVPSGVFAEQWIGISRDEFSRAKDSDVRYARNAFPLLDLDGAADGRTGWTRSDCLRYLRANGFANTPKSACIGCPFHGNAQWRRMRDEHPEEWADAVDFDASIRKGSARATANGHDLLGEAYLHRSRLPLSQAPIDRVTAYEWKSAQGDLFDAVADAELEDGDPDGCSPWSCRSGSAVSGSGAAV